MLLHIAWPILWEPWHKSPISVTLKLYMIKKPIHNKFCFQFKLRCNLSALDYSFSSLCMPSKWKLGENFSRVPFSVGYFEGSVFPGISFQMSRVLLSGTFLDTWGTCVGFSTNETNLLSHCGYFIPTHPSLSFIQIQTFSLISLHISVYEL